MTRPLHKRIRAARCAWTAGAVLSGLAALTLSLTGPTRAAWAACAFAGFALAGRAFHVSWVRAKAPTRDPDVELLRGMTLLLADDRFGAEAAFRDLIARWPRDVEATIYLGLTLRAHGDLKGSTHVLKRAMRIDLDHRWTREILNLLNPA